MVAMLPSSDLLMKLFFQSSRLLVLQPAAWRSLCANNFPVLRDSTLITRKIMDFIVPAEKPGGGPQSFN
jgi:hypothetical protein